MTREWGKIILKRFIAAAAAASVFLTPGLASAQSYAPGQSRADYLAWLAQAPDNRDSVRQFRDFLSEQGVDDVIPVWQLVRTSAAWRQCAAERFEVAPAGQWSNIVTTLSFVKNEVQPAIGDVEALSVFRNERLNGCSRGARLSAHRMFFAMDLVPASDIGRTEMIRSLCAAHARSGRDYNAGLGFYSASRFHVDSSGFRKWGVDGRGASSPCNRRIA